MADRRGRPEKKKSERKNNNVSNKLTDKQFISLDWISENTKMTNSSIFGFLLDKELNTAPFDIQVLAIQADIKARNDLNNADNAKIEKILEYKKEFITRIEEYANKYCEREKELGYGEEIKNIKKKYVHILSTGWKPNVYEKYAEIELDLAIERILSSIDENKDVKQVFNAKIVERER